MLLNLDLGTSQDGDLEVLLSIDEIATQLQNLKESLGDCPAIVRRKGNFAHPLTTEDFWALSFVQLYPYGIGYLTETVNTTKYTRHTLECGIDRRFQGSSSYIFTRYHYEMRRKFGAVCSLIASKDAVNDESGDDKCNDVTAGDMLNIIKLQTDVSTSTAAYTASNERIDSVLKRLVPFGRCIPGTIPDIQLAKKHVLAMLNSPVILERAEFTWFSTVAFADTYDPILYAILKYELPERSDDLNGDYDKLYDKASRVDLPEREMLLRKHPALSCRVFYLKQQAVLEYILKGKHAPLGKVTFNICIVKYLITVFHIRQNT